MSIERLSTGERILIAIDGSKPSEWAIQTGRQLAEQLNAHVRLVYVVESTLLIDEEFMAAEQIAARRSQQGTELLEQTRTSFPPRLQTETILREGSAFEEITCEAREWSATLIVVGTHGRNRIAGLVLGCTAEAVLRQSPCPVIAVGHEPREKQTIGLSNERCNMDIQQSKMTCCGKPSCPNNAKPKSFKRLLVAVDNSEQSAFAVDAAAGLATELHADVVVTHIVVLPLASDPQIALVEPDVYTVCMNAAESLLERTKGRMPASLHVDTDLRQGDPAVEILNSAQYCNADLIIMGTHARGRMAQAMLGSVAQAVTRKATCPVLTVAHSLPVNDKSSLKVNQTIIGSPR